MVSQPWLDMTNGVAKAGLDGVERGAAGPDRAGHGVAGPGPARQGRAGQSKASVPLYQWSNA